MNATMILVIEDDPDILELVQYNLERQGYKVLTASDGDAGIKQAIKVKPDLIILDLMLPGIDGLTVCKKLRQSQDTQNIPIIMLTAKGEEVDVVTGLEVGADDYVTKPFSPKELIARVRALLRRLSSASDETTNKIQFGPITIDISRHEVFYHNEQLKLTLSEFKLLQILISKPGRVFTRDQLLEKIAGGDTYLVDRNVDVHINSLRKKLYKDNDFISTVRGVGYKCKD